MIAAVPPDYHRYGAVIARFDPVKPSGGGLTVRCPIGTRHRNGDAHPSCRLWIASETRDRLMAKCHGCGAGWGDIVAAVGLPSSFWFRDSNIRERQRRMDETKVIRRETDRYPYHTEDGYLIGSKIRLEPGKDGRSKDFAWERDLPDAARHQFGIPDGVKATVNSLAYGFYTGVLRNGEYKFHQIFGRHEKSVELPAVNPLLSLWRLPQIVAADPRAPVFVVEGEKVAKELVRLGFQATTGYAGMGKWDYTWGRYFAGRRVVVVPDRDPKDVALAYGHTIAGSCFYYEAAEVRVVTIPCTELDPKGGDLCHWLARDVPGRKELDPADVAGRKAAVVALAKRSPAYGKAA